MKMSMKESRKREEPTILSSMMMDMAMLMKEEKFGSMRMSMKPTEEARRNSKM